MARIRVGSAILQCIPFPRTQHFPQATFVPCERMAYGRLCREVITAPMANRRAAGSQAEVLRERGGEEIRGPGQQHDLVIGTEVPLQLLKHEGAQRWYQDPHNEFRAERLDPLAVQTGQIGLVLARHVPTEARAMTQQKGAGGPPLRRSENSLACQLRNETTLRTGSIDQGAVEIHQHQPFCPCVR